MGNLCIDKLNLDKVIYIPAGITPHKTYIADIGARYEMVKLAIKNNSKFEISNVEYELSEKSYSFITVKKIIEQYRINGRLNFIIGSDAFDKIDSWYKADELKNLVHFIVFPRRGDIIKDKESWDYELTDMNFIDVSSTEIRNGIKKDTSVEGYIKENGLYEI